MNKDSVKKSLKDIKLNEINLNSLKNIKNKKEIIICILILIYIIVIICIGSFLLSEREEVKNTYEIKERRYNLLQNALSEDEIKENIEELVLEKEKLSIKFVEVENNNALINIFNDFKSKAPIKWDKEEISIKASSKSLDYDSYSYNINSFSGTFEQVEQFLEYVDNYDKIVRIDTISIRQDKITGKMNGQVRLSFYFKKIAE